MTSAAGWTADDIPALDGHRFVVTGANSGLGYETALALARRGGEVTMACRNPLRGADALARVTAESGSAAVRLAALDLADLASVRSFASQWSGPLDGLVNNAGVIATARRETADGFEQQLGINHLGHFALTGLLMPALRQSDDARVVSVSSVTHRYGRIDFDDLQSTRQYGRFRAYTQSKLAVLMFALELDDRLQHAGEHIKAVAVHPGVSATGLSSSSGGASRRLRTAASAAFRFASQSPAAGALPTLYAATMPDVVGGEFFGPGGMRQLSGSPIRVGCSQRALDREVSARLWDVSEQLTGVSFGFGER
jgi:NAD(P)-dependent dehydrogenase (short-subunit alcohol dehydrogenase family)